VLTDIERTDIERSTRLLGELGQDAYREGLLAPAVVTEACARHGGYEVDCEGDAFLYTFQSATVAVAAAEQAVRAGSRTSVDRSGFSSSARSGSCR
jgi:class 3 adenylate cyclase